MIVLKLGSMLLICTVFYKREGLWTCLGVHGFDYSAISSVAVDFALECDEPRNASRKKVFVSGMLRVFHLVLRCCPVDGESTILLETSPDESK